MLLHWMEQQGTPITMMRTLGDEAARIAGRLARELRSRETKERRSRLGNPDIVELVFIDAPANDRSRASLTRGPADALARKAGGGDARKAE